MQAFIEKNTAKILDLGPNWFRAVRQELPADFARRCQNLKPIVLNLALLDLHQEPEEFVGWLRQLSGEEAISLLKPFMPPDYHLDFDLASTLVGWAEVLSIWHSSYFKTLDPQIPRVLAADFQRRRAQVAKLTPEQQIDQATNGISLELPKVTEVVLLPQYHFRPWNIYERLNEQTFQIGYPVDLPAVPGEPGPELLRLSRALADPNRLRILRFLAGGRRSFTEVVPLTGLAKSTVHHHIVILRASGLVRVHVTETGDRYSLRQGALDTLGARFGEYFRGGKS